MKQHFQFPLLLCQTFLSFCSVWIFLHLIDFCANMTLSLENYTLPPTLVSDVVFGVLPDTRLSPSFLTLSQIPFGLTRRSISQYQNDLISTLPTSYTLIDLDKTMNNTILYNRSKWEMFQKNSHLTKVILNNIHFTFSHSNGTNPLKHGAILIVIEEDKIVELFTKSYIFANVFCPYSFTKTPIIFHSILEKKTSPYAYIPILSSSQTFVINFHTSIPYILVMVNCFNTTEPVNIHGNITSTNSYGTLPQNDISIITCYALSSVFFLIVFLVSFVHHVGSKKFSKNSRVYFVLPSFFLFLESFFIWNFLKTLNFTNHFSSLKLILCSLTSSLTQIIFYSLCFLVIKCKSKQQQTFRYIESKFVLFVLLNFFIFETIRQSIPPHNLFQNVFLVHKLSVYGSFFFKLVIIVYIYKEYYFSRQMSHQGLFYPSKFFLTTRFVNCQTGLAILAILTNIVDHVNHKQVYKGQHNDFIFSHLIPSLLWAMAVICLLCYSQRIYVVNETLANLETTIRVLPQSITPSFELHSYQPVLLVPSESSHA